MQQDQGYGQPQPQGYYPPPQPTVVVVNQPQSQDTNAGQPQNIREWSIGICGCFEDFTGCLYCFFCHSCFMSTLATQMGECVFGPSTFGFPFETAMRTKLRAQYGIKGPQALKPEASICNGTGINGQSRSATAGFYSNSGLLYGCSCVWNLMPLSILGAV